MEGNPYSTIVEIFKGIAKDQIPVTFRTGKIVSVSPLRVETGGIVLESQEVYVNHELINNSQRNIVFDVTSSDIKINGEDVSMTGEMTGSSKSDDFGFAVGDRVVLLTEGDTTFYLLCKVVKT